MSKEILFGNEAHKKIETGVRTLAGAVKITLGPKGRNAVLERKFASPLVTNDGVTIAKDITLKDPFENIGCELIKEVSIKTNEIAGDGTTTAIVLCEALVLEGFKNIASGANPIIMRKGMEKAKEIAVKEIKRLSKPVQNSTEIKQVATISSASEKIGELIAQAMEKVSQDGIITVEESKTAQTSLNIVEGFQFDRGYISPYMTTDTNKMQTVFTNPNILITDKKISTSADFINIAEILIANGEPLVIIAEDIDGEALATLLLNKMRGSFACVGIKAPAFGEKRKEILQDIATLTGATYFAKDMNMDIKTATESDLGKCKQITVSASQTTIIEGLGNPQQIEQRKQEIKTQLQNAGSDYDKERLTERLGKFIGGVAVINVGSNTETEMREMKLRIEDALSATKSATQEGIVAGGGCTYIKIIEHLKEQTKNLTGDEKTGANIVAKALEAPVRQIAHNTGVDGGVVLNTIKQNTDTNFGYDALTDTYTNMLDAGIIDPAKVSRCALENAISIASTLLTTNVVVANPNENEQN